LGFWISPYYGLFSLGWHFETYELFMSLIFQFLGGHGEMWVTETTDTESADTGALLYLTQQTVQSMANIMYE
jgi:hypothetical protein